MRKHIYLHTSNLEMVRDLREDNAFDPLYEYPPNEISRSFPNEYGRIKTLGNYYHIMLGQIQQDGCPWCSGPPEVIKLWGSTNTRYAAYCIQCMQCGSRGPVLNISSSAEENKEVYEEHINFMWQRYKRRRAWDDDFVNPYGNN